MSASLIKVTNMKIIKFRVKNYRSITDIGDCFLTDNITILAGKNESGKTSLLEALEDFDTDKTIREDAKPIKNPEDLPEISITFEINDNILKEVFNEIGVEKKPPKNITLEITKQFPDSYSISDASLEKLKLKDKATIEKEIKRKIQILRKTHKEESTIGCEIPSPNFDDIESISTSISKYETATSLNLEIINITEEKEKLSTIIQELKNDIERLNKLQDIDVEFLNVLKKNYIPYFILFNSFDDIFPNKIPFSELEENEWIKDLSVISNLNIESIKDSNDRTKEKHKDDVNITLNKDYKQFWTQDMSSLSVNWDSEHLYFWIKEYGYSYEPSLRSKGRQWHLAFYIKVTARAKEDVPNIILIDEPGLFLHAKAQKDILGKLEDSTKYAQLIFSTHSPYLLESEKLNRIRLIFRTKKDGTRVENKIHALADKETLTPILTAIGLELNTGITNIDKTNNIVVEGPSDLFYLEGFKKILKNNNLSFVFGGGAGNMPFVGTILHGWGCKVLYLYDRDQGKKDGTKNLTKNWLVSAELITSVLSTEGTIEDIFVKEDFQKYVLNNAKEYSDKNSDYLKKKKIDKVLLARLFLQSVEKGDVHLSNKSKDNIKELFKIIEDKLRKEAKIS